mgnify:CR=1 FL=1
MQTLKINIAAVLTLTVAHQITNFLWYSLAGQDWITLSGLTLEQIEAN